MNFYDYFEELPPIIEDDNQEIYHPLSSLGNYDNNNNNEGILYDKDNIYNKDLLIPYYCAICGSLVIIINHNINKFKRRKIDNSIHLKINNTDIFYKLYSNEYDKIIVINYLKYKNKKELRRYIVL